MSPFGHFNHTCDRRIFNVVILPVWGMACCLEWGHTIAVYVSFFFLCCAMYNQIEFNVEFLSFGWSSSRSLHTLLHMQSGVTRWKLKLRVKGRKWCSASCFPGLLPLSLPLLVLSSVFLALSYCYTRHSTCAIALFYLLCVWQLKSISFYCLLLLHLSFIFPSLYPTLCFFALSVLKPLNTAEGNLLQLLLQLMI